MEDARQSMAMKPQSQRNARGRLAQEFQNAVGLHQQGKLEQAERLYKGIIKAEPQHFDAVYLLGLLHHKQNRNHEALECLNAALQLQPTNSAVLSRLARIHTHLGHATEALTLYDKALANNPRELGALVNRGNLLLGLERPRDALLSFDAALAINPKLADAFNNRGSALRMLQSFEAAIESFDEAIAINPQLAEPFNNRGLALRDLKRFDEALANYDQALTLRPNYAEAFNNKGNALMALGRADEALLNYEQALGLQPDAETLNNRGNALAGLKRPEEALASYDEALALKPDYAEAHNNRGNALRDLKRFEEALRCYDQALALRPNYPEALNNRGNLFIDLCRPLEALANCDEALALKPDYPEAMNSRGTALRDLQRTDEALASYDKALTLNPEYAEAFHNRGLVLSELGRFDEAGEALQMAIALAPRRARFYYNLAMIKRLAPEDPHVGAMEELAQDRLSLTPDDYADLQFALGKIFADRSAYDRSFQHLLEANAAKRNRIIYDEATSLEVLRRTRAAFSPAIMRSKAGLGEKSQRPIFVLGMPRSGSTLVEQILASHPKVFGAGETDEFNKTLLAVLGELNSPEALDNLERDADEKPVPTFSHPTLAGLSRQQLQCLGKSYLDRVQMAAPSSERIIDKTLDNFRFVGLIHLALPNARIIHIGRDPIDTCVSCFSKQFSGNVPYSYNLAELGRYYRAYEKMMAHWRNVMPAGAMLELHYEELVADLEAQARRILTYCNLEWDEHCLDFHRTKRPVRTASQTQVRQPLFTSSVGRWRAYEAFLGPLLAELEPGLPIS